jgi:hypothetical protein
MLQIKRRVKYRLRLKLNKRFDSTWGTAKVK